MAALLKGVTSWMSCCKNISCPSSRSKIRCSYRTDEWLSLFLSGFAQKLSISPQNMGRGLVATPSGGRGIYSTQHAAAISEAPQLHATLVCRLAVQRRNCFFHLFEITDIHIFKIVFTYRLAILFSQSRKEPITDAGLRCLQWHCEGESKQFFTVFDMRL